MRNAEGLNLVAKVTDSQIAKLLSLVTVGKVCCSLCVNVKSAAVEIKSMNITKDLCMDIKETNKKTFIVISALRNKNKYEALISVARQYHP